MRQIAIASTEPVIFITGKALTLLPVPHPLIGFNGAGDLHHRKGENRTSFRIRRYTASTEPVIFITGKLNAVVQGTAADALQRSR